MFTLRLAWRETRGASRQFAYLIACITLGVAALVAVGSFATSLERTVPAHFGLKTPTELAEAMHEGRVAQRRVIELAPLVLAEAADDPVAATIVQHLADEVVALARVALTRLDLADQPVEVLLGGGAQRGRPRTADRARAARAEALRPGDAARAG